MFAITLLVTVFVFYFWSVLAVLFAYMWPVTAIYFSGAFIFTGLYLWYLRGGTLRSVSVLYYLLVFVMLGVAWLPSGGLKGAITFFVVLVYISGLLVLDPKDFKLFIFVSLGIVTVFTAWELIFPGSAAPYLDEFGHLRDLAIVNMTMLAVLSIAIYTFKKAHVKDRVRLKRANNSLQVQKQKVEQADKAKTTFLANVSHEMRTPLNGIVGTAELLERTTLSQEQREMVQDLIYSSDILKGLISNVLDISMIEEGKMVLLSNQFDYHKVIADVVGFFKPMVAPSNLELISEVDYAIPVKLLGDPGRIRQVLINLINNSVKFTESGHVKVTARLLDKDHERVYLKTTVEDTGRGISPEHQQHIFDEFHREDRIKSIEGTGLGLPICLKIITAMSGSIQLDKSDSSGSVFSFVIPLAIAEGKDRKQEPVVELLHEEDFGGLKVLIAEDQPINQMVLKKMLKNLNIDQVDVVENGQQAVDKALDEAYDFILMDIRMPVKDGIVAAKEILGAVNDPQPVIISITANALKVDQDACFEVGIKDFISKPFSLEVLKNTLVKYVGREG